ncbi:MAG: class I SAM-dependent methyltransferase [Patescibacteria group bacterium]
MTKLYNQKKLWIGKWENGKVKAVNNYARRSFSEIKKHGELKTLLDLGCGAGQDAVYFAKQGLRVTAADFSESGLRFVPGGVKNLESVCLDISDLNLKNNSFDVIYAHLSLHYFDDNATTQIFNKLYSVLKKGGLIFIKCKSKDDALYGIGEKIESDMFYKDNHVRHFFTKEYMKEKLAKFDLIKIRKTSSVYRYYKSAYIEAIATKK